MQTYKVRWFWLVFLCLSTHALLDSFTVYGTQLMWPFTEHPFALSNMFIIDPLYTLPLLLGVVCTLLPRVSSNTAYKINSIALGLSSLYLCTSFALKVMIDDKVKTALNNKNIKYEKYISTPAPLTTLLWRVVVMSDDHYYEGYASVFDEPDEVTLSAYPTNPSLLNNIKNEWGVKRLQWFTKGFYSVREQQNKVILSDLRMGMECQYVFNFQVGEINSEGVTASNFDKISQRPSFNDMDKIWDRIWQPSNSLLNNTCNNDTNH